MTTLAFVSTILSINRLIEWLIIAALSPVEALGSRYFALRLQIIKDTLQ